VPVQASSMRSMVRFPVGVARKPESGQLVLRPHEELPDKRIVEEIEAGEVKEIVAGVESE